MLTPEMPLDMGYGVLGYMISEEEEEEEGTIVRSEIMLAFSTFNTQDITERKFESEGEVPDKNGYLGMIGYEGYPYPDL